MILSTYSCLFLLHSTRILRLSTIRFLKLALITNKIKPNSLCSEDKQEVSRYKIQTYTKTRYSDILNGYTAFKKQEIIKRQLR